MFVIKSVSLPLKLQPQLSKQIMTFKRLERNQMLRQSFTYKTHLVGGQRIVGLEAEPSS